ncbi:hypothetical protein C8T65DRAFT_700346 [Cerioporus squamosus]|nr:hypothetical protein C8T65DRAFT_700346 [Cerioporus squamosus]
MAMNQPARGATSLRGSWDTRSSGTSEQSLPLGPHAPSYDWAFAHLQPHSHPATSVPPPAPAPAPAPAFPTPSLHDFPHDTRSQSSLSPHSHISVEGPPVATARAGFNDSATMNFSWMPTAAVLDAHHGGGSATGGPGRSRQNNNTMGKSEQQRKNVTTGSAWSMAIPAMGQSLGFGYVLQDQSSGSYRSMGAVHREGVAQYHQPTLQMARETTSANMVPTSVQQPDHIIPRLSLSSVEGMAMQNSTYISASEVMPYVSVDDFADIIRKLYLPCDVPRWQQLVRVAVLVVGLIEDLRRNDGYAGLHHVVHPRDFVSPAEWVSEWLDLQPGSRFPGPQATSITHPGMLLYPAHSRLEDWGQFLTRSRQVVFRVLLGLRSCSPYVSHPEKPHLMNQDDWAAWADDVLWVLFQVLNHVKMYKEAHSIPAHARPDAQVSQSASSLRTMRHDAAVEPPSTRLGLPQSEPRQVDSRAGPSDPQISGIANTSPSVGPEPVYRKRTLDDPEESVNKRLRATDTLTQDRKFQEEGHVDEEDEDEDMWEEGGEAY